MVRRTGAGQRFADLGPEWVSLGRQRVEQRGDSAVIKVGRQEGRFDALVLRVRRSPIRLRTLEVVYGNRERETLDTPVRIEAGADSDIIELADYSGRGRNISEVRLSWGTRDASRPAVVEVFAHKAAEERFADLGPEWVSLGRQRVEQRGDSAVIKVGRQEGRFDELVLRIRRSPIRLRNVTVVYGNGQQEVLEAQERIDAGSDSEALELSGSNDRGRFIREIRLSYGTRDASRPAVVEVFAHKAPEERFADLGAGWSGIGKAQLTDRRGRIALDLTGYEKRLDSFVLRMRRGSLTHNEVAVVFEDGQRQVFDRSGRIDSGDQSAPFELDRRGRGRFIDRIEIAYRVEADGRRTPEVELWGEEARARQVDFEPLRGRGWQEVGTATVDGRRDRDRITIGRRAGAFSELVLRFDGNNVRLARARVTYGNGETEDLPARGYFGPGEQTDVLPLTVGRRGGRFIESIELAYEQTRGRGGPAEIEVWARRVELRSEPQPRPRPPVVFSFPDLGPDWTAISNNSVQSARRTEVVTMGAGMGGFEGLLFRVMSGTAVAIDEVTVHFGNGSSQKFGFKGALQPGFQSELVELNQQRTHINRIELKMQRSSISGDAPLVSIWGLRSKAAPRSVTQRRQERLRIEDLGRILLEQRRREPENTR